MQVLAFAIKKLELALAIRNNLPGSSRHCFPSSYQNPMKIPSEPIRKERICQNLTEAFGEELGFSIYYCKADPPLCYCRCNINGRRQFAHRVARRTSGAVRKASNEALSPWLGHGWMRSPSVRPMRWIRNRWDPRCIKKRMLIVINNG